MLKQPRIFLRRWTQAANGETCVGCHGLRCNPDTTVAAHIKIKGVTNHGAGMKPDDFWIAFLGVDCHFDLDNGDLFKTKNERLKLVHATWRRLHEIGVIG